MELITHSLAGVIIQIICFKFLIFPLNLILTMIFAFFSHFVIDTLAKLTYHTPESRKEDKFWLIWHILILTSSTAIIVVFIVPFWLGILLANLIDIWDWLILRTIRNRKRKKNPESNWANLNKYFIHNIIDWIREKPCSWLPNLNYKKYGIIVEIIFIVFLSILILVFL
ncbi:MAG: hypothetical protein ACFFBT_16090 [Promethearchaeota archaeon]